MSSSLAYSEYNDEGSNNSNSDYIDNRIKKPRRNTTQKLREPMTTQKVDSNVLAQLHNSSNDDEDDINAYSPPKSAGSERKQMQEEQKESMINMTIKNDQTFRTLGSAPQPNEDEFDANDYSNYGDAKSNEEYYKRMLPGYLQQQQQLQQKNLANKPYYSQVNYNPVNSNMDDNVLLQKMNYMITLLEDQQDERTNNVTEEVILYSFLGIFIIFIADTFVRAGKYVR